MTKLTSSIKSNGYCVFSSWTPELLQITMRNRTFFAYVRRADSDAYLHQTSTPSIIFRDTVSRHYRSQLTSHHSQCSMSIDGLQLMIELTPFQNEQFIILSVSTWLEWSAMWLRLAIVILNVNDNNSSNVCLSNSICNSEILNTHIWIDYLQPSMSC